jgi:hypothetical protein
VIIVITVNIGARRSLRTTCRNWSSNEFITRLLPERRTLLISPAMDTLAMDTLAMDTLCAGRMFQKRSCRLLARRLGTPCEVR